MRLFQHGYFQMPKKQDYLGSKCKSNIGFNCSTYDGDL